MHTQENTKTWNANFTKSHANSCLNILCSGWDASECCRDSFHLENTRAAIAFPSSSKHKHPHTNIPSPLTHFAPKDPKSHPVDGKKILTKLVPINLLTIYQSFYALRYSTDMFHVEEQCYDAWAHSAKRAISNIRFFAALLNQYDSSSRLSHTANMREYML